MPVRVSTKRYSDSYNSGTTIVPIVNVSDNLTAEVTFSYENDWNSNFLTSVKLTFIEAETFDSQYTGQAAILLNTFFSTSNTFTTQRYTEQFNELIGQSIFITATKPAYNGNATVVDSGNSFLGEFIVLDIAYSLGSNIFGSGRFWVDTPITALELQYSYDRSNDNDYTGALSSVLIQNFATNNSVVLDHTNTTPVPVPFKNPGSYRIGTLTVEGTNTAFPSRQEFKIIHELEILPIAESDNASLSIDFTNAFRYRILPKAFFNSSPIQQFENGAIQSGDTADKNLLVGLLNTNYNNPTNYSYSNFNIVRTSDSAPSGVPIVQEQFTVTFDVDNTTRTPFSDSNTFVQVGILNTPTTLTSGNQDYEEHFLYDRVIAQLGDAPASGVASGIAASITNYTAVFNSSSSISVSFDVDYTASAESQINNDSALDFTIICSTQDHTLTYNNSDRTVLEVFSGKGITKIVGDAVVVTNNEYVTHPYGNVEATLGTIDGFPVQDLVASTTFNIDWSGRDNLRFNRISQNIVLKNTSTLEEIELVKTNIPVNSFNLINGTYPTAGYSVEKGFNIPIDEIRNKIEFFEITSTPSATTREYVVSFPFFVRWEYYRQLILNNIPADLIDTNEPFNGINLFLHRYDTIADWDVFYRLTFELTEEGQNVVQTYDSQITTTDYGQHPDIVSRELKTYAEDKVTELPLVEGDLALDENGRTYLEMKWDFSGAITTADYECAFFIENFENGSPTSIQRISSVNGLISSSWFEDTGAGNGLIEKAVDGNTAIARAYINNSKITKSEQFRIYPEIYSPAYIGGGLLAEDGTSLITEDGNNIIPE